MIYLYAKHFLQSLVILNGLKRAVQNVLCQFGFFLNEANELRTFVWKNPYTLLQLQKSGVLKA